jgi:peptide deformylase
MIGDDEENLRIFQIFKGKIGATERNMALLPIATLPDPVLRRKAHKITTVDKELQGLIDDMIETMREAPGVGLAAPQISQSIRLIVVEYGEEDEEGNQVSPKKLYVVINPEIVAVSEEKEMGVEACLSIPNLAGDVERHVAIVVKGVNRFGKPARIKADGWLARIFQHEIDHLDGIVFPDRATRVWKPTREEEKLLKD